MAASSAACEYHVSKRSVFAPQGDIRWSRTFPSMPANFVDDPDRAVLDAGGCGQCGVLPVQRWSVPATKSARRLPTRSMALRFDTAQAASWQFAYIEWMASSDSHPLRIVVLGASAGGVQALVEIVHGLPADLPAAIFVVMHIPSHSQSQLHRVLQAVTSLKVSMATDGSPFQSGHVYVAPPDRHLVIEANHMRLTRAPRECRARPSVDVLFRSAAASHGPRVIGVVLTGALDDGTAGLWAIKDCGGVALVQDPATAEHASMSDSARRHVDVDAVLPLPALAAEIEQRTRATVPRALRSPRESVRIETAIALGGNSLEAGVMKLGSSTPYTCPDCHRVLTKIREGSIVRFRCYSGHAHSINTLLADVDRAIEANLWDSIRAMEERCLLVRQLEQIEAQMGAARFASRCAALAGDSERRAKVLRAMVADPELLRQVDALPDDEQAAPECSKSA